jgi:TRAP-type C4-dicarboxylate transport system substrate-binding protein
MTANDRKTLYIPTATWISKAWANKLPADLREMVMTVPRELEDKASQEALNSVESTKQAWRDVGVEIINFSAADQKRYLAKLRPLGDQYLGRHSNPQVREIYGLFRKVAEKHRPRS